MGRKNRDMIFTILGGPTYSSQDRPPFWHNETPIYWESEDMRHLPLHTFPLVEDLEVLLEKVVFLPKEEKESKRNPFGYHVHFFSPPRGYIASFPWWDHAEQDLRRKGFAPPLGTVDQPYSDLEQGWIIAIASYEHFVYVIEGNFDRTLVDHLYHSWFKVPEERYLDQWQRAIQICHQFNDE